MPKRIFWPATLVIMGIIFLASNLGLLPLAFWNLWPIILIVAGLGGLLISDREDWNSECCDMDKKTMSKTKTPAKKKKVAAKKK